MIANPPVIEPPQTPYETLREELREHEEKDVCHLLVASEGVAVALCGTPTALGEGVGPYAAERVLGSVLATCDCGRKRCSRCAEIWLGL